MTKIFHITASYKSAYIYGGPIYSVAALCEALYAESLRPKAESGDLETRDQTEVRSREMGLRLSSKRADGRSA